MKNIDDDMIRDIAIDIVDEFVKQGLVKDCIDTDDQDEFIFQDIVFEKLQYHLKC